MVSAINRFAFYLAKFAARDVCPMDDRWKTDISIMPELLKDVEQDFLLDIDKRKNLLNQVLVASFL